MSLEKWAEYGWLRREPTNPSELKGLLGSVGRNLADSKVEAVSMDRRFVAAFNAALAVATRALRNSGHRTITQTGHHVKTIESLELTIKASPKIIQDVYKRQEEGITGAFIRDLKSSTRTVCFVSGSGEHQIDDSDRGGLSHFKDLLAKDNYESKTINLLQRCV